MLIDVSEEQKPSITFGQLDISDWFYTLSLGYMMKTDEIKRDGWHSNAVNTLGLHKCIMNSLVVRKVENATLRGRLV